MARMSKHRMLAKSMQKMTNELDQYFATLIRRNNVIQLLFLEVQYVVGRPPLTERAMKAMTHTYSIGARHLAPREEVRKLFASVPLARPYFKSYFLYPPAKRLRQGWFTPWRVVFELPDKIQEDLQRWCEQSFLYCPSIHEIDKHHDWFQKERALDSFTHQLRSIQAVFHEEGTINSNAREPALPVFEEAIERWRESEDEHSDKIPKKDDSLHELPFAPKDGQDCWSAFQIVVNLTNDKHCQHRRGLLSIYRKLLEDVFFRGLDLQQSVKESYLAEFRAKSLGTSLRPKTSKEGRWKQAEIPDCWILSKTLRYIVHHFIGNPHKKMWGEASLALWIMVWCAQEGYDSITELQILDLRTNVLNILEATLQIGEFTVEISDGLALLINSFTARNSGKQNRRLFQHLDYRSIQRIVHESSLAVQGSDKEPIAPSAFLTSPHVYPDIRISTAQRQAMRDGRQMVEPMLPLDVFP